VLRQELRLAARDLRRVRVDGDRAGDDLRREAAQRLERRRLRGDCPTLYGLTALSVMLVSELTDLT
jgi:predicted transcriptional regulator